MADLPTLDFSLFTKGNEAESKKCAEKIVQSFKDHGFVKLTNHGIPEETVKTYMGAVSKISREGAHSLPRPLHAFESPSALRKENN